MIKRGIDLRPGDKILDEQGPCPETGEVELVTVIDRGVQIRLTDGRMIVRPEDHEFAVAD